MRLQVVDGTPCDLRDGLRRVCVEGECMVVGCDGKLGSDVQEDNCRVCGGNGANCNTVTGELGEQDQVQWLAEKLDFLIVYDIK